MAESQVMKLKWAFDLLHWYKWKLLCHLNKFEVCVSHVQQQHFPTFLFGFSVWFFKMELSSLLDLLNTGFTIIIENGLCFGGKEVKICKINS